MSLNAKRFRKTNRKPEAALESADCIEPPIGARR